MYGTDIKEYLQKTNIHIYIQLVPLNSFVAFWTVNQPHAGQMNAKIRWMKFN